MSFRLILFASAALALGVGLSGCSSDVPPSGSAGPPKTSSPQGPMPSATTRDSSPSPADSSAPTSSPGSAGAYPDIVSLKRALEGAGVDCAGWNLDDLVDNSAESGWCDSGWGLSTYASVEARNALLDLNWGSAEPQPFLAGDTWLITRGYEDATELDRVQPSVGGVVIAPGDSYPS